MKVCLVGAEGDFVKDDGDGVKRYMYEIYTQLHKLEKEGLRIEKHEFKRLPFFAGGFSPAIGSIFYNFSKYDIIHNLEPKPLMPTRRGNALQITTMHDFHGLLRPEKEDYLSITRRLGLKFVLQYGLKQALKTSDYIFCNSTQTKNEAVELGFAKEKIFVTALGVDDRYLKPRRLKKSQQIYKVGYIGSLSATKNVGFAIKAFKKVKGKNFAFEIWGKWDREYSHLVEMSKEDKRIKFMGFAPEDKIVDIYDSFDLFVHPSLYEGFCLPILEAQNRGLPVVTYSKAVIPNEIKRHTIQVNDEDEMAAVISSRPRQQGEAHSYARKFTWKECARKTLEAYEKILSE